MECKRCSFIHSFCDVSIFYKYKYFSSFEAESVVKSPRFNRFKPEFIMSNFIHCKPRTAVTILDLQWMKKRVANEKTISLLLEKLHKIIRSKTHRCRRLGHLSNMQDFLLHREGLWGFNSHFVHLKLYFATHNFKLVQTQLHLDYKTF